MGQKSVSFNQLITFMHPQHVAPLILSQKQEEEQKQHLIIHSH
jgi:hypothetical protein